MVYVYGPGGELVPKYGGGLNTSTVTGREPERHGEFIESEFQTDYHNLKQPGVDSNQEQILSLAEEKIERSVSE